MSFVENRVVILGAGMSGLMAAQSLRRESIPVTLLDKGNRPGGRMATKPFEGAVFDYGAQFFTVRHERFAAFQRSWETRGLVKVWGHGFNGDTDGHPRYIGHSGMNSIPAFLAQGLDVHTGVKVSRITPSHRGWTLETDIDESIDARALIVTCPVPQALALFDFPLATQDRESLEKIEYDRCLALMAILEQDYELPTPGAQQIAHGEPISWLADNHRKGISPQGHPITIHAGPKFSLDNWERDADTVAAKLLNGHRAVAWKLHRWKYSRPTSQFADRCLALNAPAPLVLAGDAFGEARVEGAALSGLAAADTLRTLL
jgi:predicted NAD/FAD-dependent oxidoreductase